MTLQQVCTCMLQNLSKVINLIPLEYMYSSFMSSESQDYTAVNVDVTLSPSTLQACTNISITDDSEPEDDETFTVTVVPSDDVDPGPDTRITIDDNGQRSP